MLGLKVRPTVLGVGPEEEAGRGVSTEQGAVETGFSIYLWPFGWSGG